MKTLRLLERSKSFWFIFTNLLLFFLLRLPSLFEPYWYGDEGIYQVLGMGINNGRTLYQQIFDNKPPLLYIFYGLFNGDQFYLRLTSLIFGLFAVITFFYLAKKLFKKNNAVYISTFLFTVLFGLPIIEGNIANAENFMLFPILSALYLAIDHINTKLERKMFFWSGIILGIAFLFKIVAVFDFLALLTFLLIIRTPKILGRKLKSQLFLELKELYSLIIGFLIPIIVTAVYFISINAYSDFITATFFSNIGYVGYHNKLIIPQGFLILKLILLGFFALFVFAKRNKLSTETIFIWIWLSFSLFNALFSQRPYTHYLLTLLPSFALLIGLLISDKKLLKLNLLLSIVIVIIAQSNFWIYSKNLKYYKNFIDFTIGNKSVSSYQNFFDRNTPVDYQITQYIKKKITQDDSVFIWGNNAQLYKLIEKLPPGKYAVAYHIVNYKDGLKDTGEQLEKIKPKIIINMPNVANYPFSLSHYKPTIMINNVQIYERVF